MTDLFQSSWHSTLRLRVRSIRILFFHCRLIQDVKIEYTCYCDRGCRSLDNKDRRTNERYYIFRNIAASNVRLNILFPRNCTCPYA